MIASYSYSNYRPLTHNIGKYLHLNWHLLFENLIIFLIIIFCLLYLFFFASVAVPIFGELVI